MLSFILAAGAGALTILSPCVLPVVPLVVGGSARSTRWGPVALLSGMILSFALIGTFATAFLFQLGLSPHWISTLGALLLILVGLFLAMESLENLFKKGSSGFSQRLDQKLQNLSLEGFQGQFVLGATIGFVWAPCTGPTLGAAIALAAQGESLLRAFITMLFFGVGAAIPLGLLGLGAKYWAQKKAVLIGASAKLKRAMGLLFIFIGGAILLNWHKWIEAKVLEYLPDWWVQLITSV